MPMSSDSEESCRDFADAVVDPSIFKAPAPSNDNQKNFNRNDKLSSCSKEHLTKLLYQNLENSLKIKKKKVCNNEVTLNQPQEVSLFKNQRIKSDEPSAASSKKSKKQLKISDDEDDSEDMERFLSAAVTGESIIRDSTNLY